MNNKLYILCGIPFAGKTTLSKTLSFLKGFVHVDLDQIKKEYLQGEFADETVTQTQWDAIYQEMYHRVEHSLKEGKTVVQDAGNFTRYERGLVRNIAEKIGVQTVTLVVSTPIEVARSRWQSNKKTKKRFDVSEENFKAAEAEFENPTPEENPLYYEGKTSIEKWIENNFS